MRAHVCSGLCVVCVLCMCVMCCVCNVCVCMPVCVLKFDVWLKPCSGGIAQEMCSEGE